MKPSQVGRFFVERDHAVMTKRRIVATILAGAFAIIALLDFANGGRWFGVVMRSIGHD